MRFSILAVSTAFVTCVAALENPISEPTADSKLVAGKTFNITWGPTTSGTISLLLKKGLSTNLATVGTIASNIPNSGFYVWSIPGTTVTGSDYAVEIDSAAKDINYTPQFAISGAAASYSSSASSSTSSESVTVSTVVSTHSTVKTSTVATNTVYASASKTTSISKPLGTGSAGIPSATNGTVVMSTLTPSAGGETSTKTGTSTGLPRPTASAPSSAGAVRVAWAMVGGAVMAVGAMLL